MLWQMVRSYRLSIVKVDAVGKGNVGELLPLHNCVALLSKGVRPQLGCNFNEPQRDECRYSQTDECMFQPRRLKGLFQVAEQQ